MTVAGTTALVLLDERLTSVPPGPPGALRVTVPVEILPPATDGGAIATLSSVPGVTVKVAFVDWPPDVAVITAAVLVETPFVVMVKVAVVAPDGTVTNAGTLAAALLLTRPTSAPPAGAG
jgi:hypothetical protein